MKEECVWIDKADHLGSCPKPVERFFLKVPIPGVRWSLTVVSYCRRHGAAVRAKAPEMQEISSEEATVRAVLES